MTLGPSLPNASRWGCASMLFGPMVLYSLLLQMARWTSWDFASRSDVLETVWMPYWAFLLPLLMLVSPFVLLYMHWSDVGTWFAVTSAYFLTGVLLAVSIDLLIFLIDRPRTLQGSKQPPETSEAIS